MSEAIKKTLKQLHASIAGLCYLGEDKEKELIEQTLAALSAEQPKPVAWVAPHEQQEQALSPRVDFYRGMGCEVRDDDPDSKTCGQWFPAKFIAIDLVGGEPIVQRHKRFPIFGVWSGVRGLPKEEIIAHYSSPVAQQAGQPSPKQSGALCASCYSPNECKENAKCNHHGYSLNNKARQPAPADQWRELAEERFREIKRAQAIIDELRLEREKWLTAPAVPEGCVLVPINPTPAMIEAGANADPERESVWEAYLSAAAPAQEGEKK